MEPMNKPSIIDSPKLSKLFFRPSIDPFTPPFYPPKNIHIPFKNISLENIAYNGMFVREKNYIFDPMDNHKHPVPIYNGLLKCLLCSRNNLKAYLYHNNHILCLSCTDEILNNNLYISPTQNNF